MLRNVDVRGAWSCSRSGFLFVIAGEVTRIAGGGSAGNLPGSADGIGTSALFHYPITVPPSPDGKVLYVSDWVSGE